MKHRAGSGWSVVVVATALGLSAPAPARGQAGAAQGTRPAPTEQVQVGATQGGPTNEMQPTPKFNMDYFHGEWNFETNIPESPMGEGGPMSGTETITDVYDGRFWLVAIKGEGPDGPYTGNGMMIYSDGFHGQSWTRYEFSRGFSLIKTGSLGC